MGVHETEVCAQLRDRPGQRGWCRRGAAQGWRTAEAGHVDRNQLSPVPETIDDRAPHVAVGAQRVQQQHRGP